MAASQKTSLNVTYRHCESDADYAACIALQEATWGADDVVPMTLLKAAQKIGGIAAGAFDESGQMLGCVFGLSGIRDEQPTHWSHMLAVVPSARGLGLGYGLKMFQRNELARIGFDHMYWTYDPLEAVNAHFNINRLGSRPVEYIQDLYGDGDANLLHRGLGTDRFVVRWDFESPPAASNANEVERIEIPPNIQDLKTAEPERAREWRRTTRKQFMQCYANGFSVAGFERTDDHRCYYILERKP